MIGDFLNRRGQARTVSAVDTETVGDAQSLLAREVAATDRALFALQSVRAVHWSRHLPWESPRDRHFAGSHPGEEFKFDPPPSLAGGGGPDCLHGRLGDRLDGFGLPGFRTSPTEAGDGLETMMN